MNRLLFKFIPTVIVLSAGGYVVWPYVGSESAAARSAQAASAADTELNDNLLRPKIVPRTVRNPFDDPEEEAERVLQDLRARTAAAVKRFGDSFAERRAKSSRQPQKTAGLKPKSAGGRDGPDAATAENPVAGLELNATYTEKGKGAALINGRVVRAGESVREFATGDHLVLAEVRQYSVILKASDRKFEIPFTHTSTKARPVASRPAVANARGGQRGGAQKGHSEGAWSRRRVPSLDGLTDTSAQGSGAAQPDLSALSGLLGAGGSGGQPDLSALSGLLGAGGSSAPAGGAGTPNLGSSEIQNLMGTLLRNGGSGGDPQP